MSDTMNPARGRRPRRSTALSRAVLVAALLLSGSCVRGNAHPAYLPPRPATADVTMTEYRFDYKPPIRAGQVVFRMRNIGRIEHELFLAPLPDDFPPIDAQLHGTERRGLASVADVRVPPGASDTFAVILEPGRYAMICLTMDPDHVSHALKGMSSEFRVR